MKSTLLKSSLFAVAFVAILTSSMPADILINGFSSVTSDGDARLRETEADGTWHHRSTTNWSIGANTLTSNPVASYNAEEEGLIGQMVDNSGGTFEGHSFELSFDYVIGVGNTLYVHLRGGDDTGALEWDINLGAQNGNAWNASNGGTGTSYNLFDGTAMGFGGSNGAASTAVQLTGSGSYSQFIDLSGYALTDVNQYEYIMLGFGQNASTDNATSINNFSLVSIPEPANASLFGVLLIGSCSRRRR